MRQSSAHRNQSLSRSTGRSAGSAHPHEELRCDVRHPRRVGVCLHRHVQTNVLKPCAQHSTSTAASGLGSIRLCVSVFKLSLLSHRQSPQSHEQLSAAARPQKFEYRKPFGRHPIFGSGGDVGWLWCARRIMVVMVAISAWALPSLTASRWHTIGVMWHMCSGHPATTPTNRWSTDHSYL